MSTRTISFLRFLPIVFVFLIPLSRRTSADVIDPEYFTKSCYAGETLVTCEFTSVIPFGPHTTDTCEFYWEDVRYRHLVGHGSSFGGEEKFCIKTTEYVQDIRDPLRTLKKIARSQVPRALGLTLVVESVIVLIYIMLSRNRSPVRLILSTILGNAISLPTLWLAAPVFAGWYGILIAGELIVLTFEAGFIAVLNRKTVRPLNALLLSMFMNAASFILGFVFMFNPLLTNLI